MGGWGGRGSCVRRAAASVQPDRGDAQLQRCSLTAVSSLAFAPVGPASVRPPPASKQNARQRSTLPGEGGDWVRWPSCESSSSSSSAASPPATRTALQRAHLSRGTARRPPASSCRGSGRWRTPTGSPGSSWQRGLHEVGGATRPAAAPFVGSAAACIPKTPKPQNPFIHIVH